MNGKVRVLGDDQGNVIRLSKNLEFGYVQLQQVTLEFNSKGWLREIRRSTNVHGKLEDLKSFGFKKDQILPGKIVIKESLEAFDQKDSIRNLKIAGKTGVVCRLYDQPIYRQSYYTENLSESDELIYHTNVDEIRDALYNETLDIEEPESELVDLEN